jgi:D-3-phosphoglycerate dehydrogenase
MRPSWRRSAGSRCAKSASEREGDYHTLVAVTVGTDHGPKAVEGTLFGNRAPRLVKIFDVPIEAELPGR